MEVYDFMTLVWSGTPTVNLEQTATLTFRDNDVRALYVDWDDGVSNKKTEANYQWVELTEPQLSVEVTHTYNKQGTFNPVVQTINSRGYVSRYYSIDSSTPGVVPWSRDTGIAPIIIADAAPTAKPPKKRYIINSAEDSATPDPHALIIKKTAVANNNDLRPYLSANRPAVNAPTAQPNNILATLKPVPISCELNAVLNPSTVPFITPLSKPNKKPPMVATQLTKTNRTTFTFRYK